MVQKKRIGLLYTVRVIELLSFVLLFKTFTYTLRTTHYEVLMHFNILVFVFYCKVAVLHT